MSSSWAIVASASSNNNNNGTNNNISNTTNVHNSFSSGATALGRHSGQNFGTTEPIRTIDYDHVTTVYARLIVDEEADYFHDYTPLEAINIPPRIDGGCGCSCYKVPHQNGPKRFCDCSCKSHKFCNHDEFGVFTR